jgi:hypothetical protein
MRLLGPVGEDEVISAFLRAEIDSDRYGEKLRRLLARDRREPSVLHQPDLADDCENRYRRQLLDEHRAYERREEMFGGHRGRSTGSAPHSSERRYSTSSTSTGTGG